MNERNSYFGGESNLIREVFGFLTIVLMVGFFYVSMYHYSASATIDPNSYSANLSVEGSGEAIKVLGAGTTEQYVGTKRTISVSTNSPSGYKILVGVPTDEESGGSLILVGGDASSPSIAPINATPSTATSLETDTWGFGIPNGTTGLPENNFSATYSSETPSSSSMYAGVKVDPNRTLIRDVRSAVSGTDSFEVYYGMRLGSDILLSAGTYSTGITYRLLFEASDVVGGEATIFPTSGPKTGLENVTITTSLKTDFIPEGISVTIDGQACDNPRANIDTGTLRVSCTTRSHAPANTDVKVSIASLGIDYTITDGYRYLETGEVKIASVNYVSGVNVKGTPKPSIGDDGNVNFDLTFKSGTDEEQEFSATYRLTMTNTTSSDYIFTAPVPHLSLRLSPTTTADVYYTLDGINVNDIIPANGSVSFNIVLEADYASGTHGVEGDIEINPVEDSSGALVGNIYGSNEGDLTGDNEYAMFQLSVSNTFTSDKMFTIGILGNDFIITNATGGYLDAQIINAESTSTYTFYVKKAAGAVYGSDYINASIMISYDGNNVSSGTLKLAVDKDPFYIDTEAPFISKVVVEKGDSIGTANVSWIGTDNVGVASYSIYPCSKNDDAYNCTAPITGISGDANSYTITGLSDGVYGIVVVGFDDEGNTATQQEINNATTDSGHASRSEDTELNWTFNITGKITNGSLSNNGGTIRFGETYTGTISANNGYNVPSSLSSVKMNGRTLTSSEYTFRNGTITINIPVDGDIEVSASCPWNWCLIEGTMITLADGTSIPVEQVNYDTLLKVWNYETGSVGAEYPAWIEKKGSTNVYQLTKFDDGTELKTSGWHGVFDVDKNLFVSIDGEDFGVGSRIYKVNDNDELEIVTVVSIEMVEEEVNYYHVVSSQYYNIIANNIITTDGATYLSNLYGFDENMKWPDVRAEVLSDPLNLYTYDDFKDIDMPLRMFEELRVREAKYLATTYGITLEMFKDYLVSNQLNTTIWLPYCDASPIRNEGCIVPPSDDEREDAPAPVDYISVVETQIQAIEDDSELSAKDDYNVPLGVSKSTEQSEPFVVEKDSSLGVAVLILAGVSMPLLVAFSFRKKR